jgi:hypothetical protein
MSTEQSVAEWVVTYQMVPRNQHPLDDREYTTEFFRGDRYECERIASAFAGGEDDRRRINRWAVVIGPADDWDAFRAAEE